MKTSCFEKSGVYQHINQSYFIFFLDIIVTEWRSRDHYKLETINLAVLPSAPSYSRIIFVSRFSMLVIWSLPRFTEAAWLRSTPRWGNWDQNPTSTCPDRSATSSGSSQSLPVSRRTSMRLRSRFIRPTLRVSVIRTFLSELFPQQSSQTLRSTEPELKEELSFLYLMKPLICKYLWYKIHSSRLKMAYLFIQISKSIQN